jgi:hypothetical protein
MMDPLIVFMVALIIFSLGVLVFLRSPFISSKSLARKA